MNYALVILTFCVYGNMLKIVCESVGQCKSVSREDYNRRIIIIMASWEENLRQTEESSLGEVTALFNYA